VVKGHLKGDPKCRSCGQDRATAPQRRWACHGLCGTCYRRWANQGYPGDGPAPPASSSAATPRDPARHLERFRELDARGLSTAEICREMGTTRRTITRYRRQIEAGPGPAKEDVAANG
jgi:hypothetical protein